MSRTSRVPSGVRDHQVASTRVDIAIIGAGPPGLFAASYAGSRGLRAALIDALPEPGGQVAVLQREKLLRDIPGFPVVSGQELIDRCRDQAAPHRPVYLLNHRPRTLTVQDDGSYLLGTHRRAEVAARAVIVTGGVGSFTPRPLPDAAQFEGRGLVYFVRDLEVMRGLDVLVVGSTGTAVDWAVSLAGTARTVTLAHRRARVRAAPDALDRLAAAPIEVLDHTEVAHLHGVDDVEAVTVFDNRDGTRRRLEVQAVVAALGSRSDLGPFRDWGIAIDGRHVLVDTRMTTNLPGVFAAGDITEYPGKLRMLAVGFGEAAAAVNSAAAYLDPTVRVFPGQSPSGG